MIFADLCCWCMVLVRKKGYTINIYTGPKHPHQLVIKCHHHFSTHCDRCRGNDTPPCTQPESWHLKTRNIWNELGNIFFLPMFDRNRGKTRNIFQFAHTCAGSRSLFLQWNLGIQLCPRQLQALGQLTRYHFPQSLEVLNPLDRGRKTLECSKNLRI